MAAVLGAAPDAVTRYALDGIRVLQFSLARPVVQRAVGDRDRHGARCALVVAALPVDSTSSA